MNDVTIIDQFLNTFASYIDSGFGLLRGEVAFLTATLIVIDMTIAGLYWAMSHATGQGDDVIAKLLRKVLYVGAFAYILNNFNWLASIVFRSFAGLGITATGSAITMENFLQPGRLAKTGIDAGAPILEQIGEMAGFPEVFVNLDPIVVMFLAWLVVVLCFFVLAIQLFITLIEFKLTTLAGFVLVPFALWIDCLACKASNWFMACIACNAPCADWLLPTRSASTLSSSPRFCDTCACICMVVCKPLSVFFHRSWASRYIWSPLTVAAYCSGYRRANSRSRFVTS